MRSCAAASSPLIAAATHWGPHQQLAASLPIAPESPQHSCSMHPAGSGGPVRPPRPHLDVHLVQIFRGEVVREVGGQRGVHQHQAEQVAHVLRHCQAGNRVKHAQRVALLQQLLRRREDGAGPARRQLAAGKAAPCSRLTRQGQPWLALQQRGGSPAAAPLLAAHAGERQGRHRGAAAAPLRACSRPTCTSRSCSEPVTISTTLSIMWP
jgi:hypothetical protein